MKSATLEKILSIPQMVQELKATPIQLYGSVLQRIQIDKEQIIEFTSWNEESYTRNCIFRNENVEIIVLCWKKGQETPIHGHGSQKCWVYQSYGSLEEKRFDQEENGKLVLKETEVLKPGELCYMDDHMGFHLITNTTEEDAVSIHFYAKPINSCLVYNTAEECFENKVLQYDKTYSV